MLWRNATRVLSRTAWQLATSRGIGRSIKSGQFAAAKQKRQENAFPLTSSSFHTATSMQASGVTADEIMENLNDLYATAKDEFEIAVEGTEENTVYAAEDREAAREALTLLKEAFDKAVAGSNPEVAKQVQGRVGQRIRELEGAVVAMEERAMEE